MSNCQAYTDSMSASFKVHFSDYITENNALYSPQDSDTLPYDHFWPVTSIWACEGHSTRWCRHQVEWGMGKDILFLLSLTQTLTHCTLWKNILRYNSKKQNSQGTPNPSDLQSSPLVMTAITVLMVQNVNRKHSN